MTATPVVIGSGQLPAAAAILITPVTVTTVITSALFANTNTAVETITLYMVRSGGTPGPANIAIPAQLLPPKGTYVSPELRGRTLNVGDALYGLSTDAGQVNFIFDGQQIT